MATTFVDYTGDGNATKAFSFPSYKEADIKVDVDGVVKTSGSHYNITSYTTTGGGNVVFTSGNIPSSPAAIRIYRDTDVDTAKATFTAGSALKAGDLNNNITQLLYAAQEEQNQTVLTSNIKDAAVTTAKIAADAVTAAKIADDVVNSEHYAAGSIDTEHIADSQVTTAKIGADAVTNAKIADDQIDSEHYVDGSIDTAHIGDSQVTTAKIADANVTTAKLAASAVTTAKITDANVTTAKIADANVTTAKIANDAITADKIADAVIVTNSEQAAASANDTTFFTTSASDARYFNVSTGDTIKDGDTFPDNDTSIATTAAINDRIIDLVDDVGGFVPIANETSFPNTNPDVNDGAGTIVSISTLASNHTSSGSGVITISNGTVGNSTVTINGAANSTTYSAGYGLLVETTTTLNTYTFHRLVPKATEVTTVAGISSAISTAATNVADIENFADKYIINNSAPTARADSSSLQTGDLWFDSSSNKVMMVYDGSSGDGFSSITPSQSTITNINSVSGYVTFTEDLGAITDAVNTGSGNNSINTVGSNITSVTTTATSIANVNTVAGAISNVNTVAGAVSNVNTVGGSIADVNRYANEYKIASSNPGSPSAGDLWYNSTGNTLNYYNGSSWIGISPGINAVVSDTSPALGGHLDCNDKNLTEVGTVSGDNLQIDFGTIA